MFNIKVVIGANYGDEGKGQMTDCFCNQAIKKDENCLVVCANGGAQRGHTVITPEGIRHVFHHFGSGTLCGADTYLPEHFILNPIFFNQELIELNKKGIKPKVYINNHCKVTTPFDMIANQLIEQSRGENRNGSCGAGIWETVLRYQTIAPYNYSCINKDFLRSLRDTYFLKRLEECGIRHIPEDYAEIYYSDKLIDNYINDFYKMMDCCEIVRDDKKILTKYQNIVFENGQGLRLDGKYGRHSTPSNTGLFNINTLLNMFDKKEIEIEVCYVTRSYMTRHGAGPFDTECTKEEINSNIVEETNVYNEFQGKFRYGKITVPSSLAIIAQDYEKLTSTGTISLAITHLNETDNKMIGSSKNFDPKALKAAFDRLYLSDGKTRESIKIWSEENEK